MVDILAFDCSLAFALSDLSASLVSGRTVIDLVRLALVPVVFLLVVARVGRQLLASLALGWCLALAVDDVLAAAKRVGSRIQPGYQRINKSR